MAYLHIDNLYKNQEILMFKECYALEKIHGTSGTITLRSFPSSPNSNTSALYFPPRYSSSASAALSAADFDRPAQVT